MLPLECRIRPNLFKKIGDRIVGLGSLDSFKPQHLSITAWAFATAGVSHPALLKKIGDHVARLVTLDSFKPQELSNNVWAFATAGVSHPELFEKVGDHIAGLDSMTSFTSQILSNTVWAYATSGHFDLRFFQRMADEATNRKEDFIETQEVANFLWACATVGYTDMRLFSGLAPVIASKLDECNDQELTNIAWAYSVANVPGQDLFVVGFGTACASNESSLPNKNLRQLHQWQLWQQEIGSGIELPPSLQEKCRSSFIFASYSESRTQDDVVRELKAAGLDVDEEVLLGSGYRIDALVKLSDGRKVVVEVDGPSHFIQRRHTGSTILKHRQVVSLDHIEVVSVPYWEWDELRNSEMKQLYLLKKIGF